MQDVRSGRALYFGWSGNQVSWESARADRQRRRLHDNLQLQRRFDACVCDLARWYSSVELHLLPAGVLTNVYAPGQRLVQTMTYSAGRLSALAQDGGTWNYSLSAGTGTAGEAEVVQVIDPRSTQVHYSFKANGLLSFRWSVGASPTAANTRSWYYDVRGRLGAVIDENGNSTEYFWDPVSGRMQDQKRVPQQLRDCRKRPFPVLVRQDHTRRPSHRCRPDLGGPQPPTSQLQLRHNGVAGFADLCTDRRLSFGRDHRVDLHL